jgi:aryl-alcohol dehydrogenase-like predicted oxidoreductase
MAEWMASRKNRDQLVIATKYTSCYPSGKGGEYIKSNFQGSDLKSMYLPLEASLKKLQTSYVDVVNYGVDNAVTFKIIMISHGKSSTSTGGIFLPRFRNSCNP